MKVAICKDCAEALETIRSAYGEKAMQYTAMRALCDDCRKKVAEILEVTVGDLPEVRFELEKLNVSVGPARKKPETSGGD